MSDGANGSTILGGNPAGDAAAGNAGAGVPASNNQITATADTGGVNNPAPNAAGNWYDNFQDNELKGYVQNKGWKDPALSLIHI